MNSHLFADIIAPIVGTPVLPVATDFDGTLAPLVGHDARAVPHAGALVGPERLSHLPHTHIAVISGRGLADLRSRLGGLARGDLAGSHGAEVLGGPDGPVSKDRAEQLRDLALGLEEIASRFKG